MNIKFILASILLLNITAQAVTQTSGRGKKGNSNSKLGTSFRFDGTTLRGKYQTSLGTNATVENDKYLDDLLGGRKNFSDRLLKDDQRN
jgi:hypothetical protein